MNKMRVIQMMRTQFMLTVYMRQTPIFTGLIVMAGKTSVMMPREERK